MTDEEQLFVELAEKLRLAHLEVTALPASEDEKSSIRRHLLVITDASKHDLPRASQRLDAFLQDLEQRFPRG